MFQPFQNCFKMKKTNKNKVYLCLHSSYHYDKIHITINPNYWPQKSAVETS